MVGGSTVDVGMVVVGMIVVVGMTVVVGTTVVVGDVEGQ